MNYQPHSAGVAHAAAGSGLTAQAERSACEARIPLGRLGTRGDVADTSSYLEGDLSEFMLHVLHMRPEVDLWISVDPARD
ncbi:hypothetical protein [Glaciibacter sp. 2TAF33]|uniref:hypothetical protein n=1 Tax=Glaciibacter sp. 2TAF33 TaxID=3233015 RepID=UPI003F8F5729